MEIIVPPFVVPPLIRNRRLGQARSGRAGLPPPPSRRVPGNTRQQGGPCPSSPPSGRPCVV
eukprot:6598576-Heterocapsa_arctica.AAC.1